MNRILIREQKARAARQSQSTRELSGLICLALLLRSPLYQRGYLIVSMRDAATRAAPVLALLIARSGLFRASRALRFKVQTDGARRAELEAKIKAAEEKRERIAQSRRNARTPSYWRRQERRKAERMAINA